MESGLYVRYSYSMYGIDIVYEILEEGRTDLREPGCDRKEAESLGSGALT